MATNDRSGGIAARVRHGSDSPAINFPGQEPLSLQETRRFYEKMYTAFPDLRHEIHDQIA